jgi:hypothetical protein
MKKMMFICVALAVAVTAAAVEKLNPKTCTEQEIRAVMAEVLSAPEGQNWRYGESNGLWQVLHAPGHDALRLEMDSAIVDSPISGFGYWFAVREWPRVSARAREKYGVAVAYAASVAACGRLPANLSFADILRNGGTLDDCLVFLADMVTFPNDTAFFRVPEFETGKKVIQKYAVMAVKAYIRSQGKSFVVKNGVNPCEAYMTGLTEALNAPRFAGLDAWLKSIGHKGIDLSRMPSEENVVKLKEDILYGRKDMTAYHMAILYICLGVDGYNKFVSEYNGD